MTIRNLISLAYGFPISEVVGGPKWLDSSRYDIEAKAHASGSTDLSMASQKLRLQTLLSDRFAMKHHRESVTRSTFRLVVAKGGAKVRKAEPNKATTGQVMSMGMFANFLRNEVGLPVIDKTGLVGNFDFAFRWSTTDGEPRAIGMGYTRENLPSASGGPQPSLFTALQESLGLRLEKENGAIPVIVIDSILFPSEN